MSMKVLGAKLMLTLGCIFTYFVRFWNYLTTGVPPPPPPEHLVNKSAIY